MTQAKRVLVEEAMGLPIVSLQVCLRSGTAVDPQGREGLSRMAAEMLRRGAGGRTREEIDDLLDLLGADLGASSGADSVSFSGHVLSRKLDEFVTVFAEVLSEPSFDQEEFEKLRREMIAALDDLRDDDRDLCARHFGRHLYGTHPYGRPASGTADSLKAISRQELIQHYEAQVRQPNVIVGTSGALDARSAQKVADRLVAGLPPGDAPSSFEFPDPTVPSGRDLLIVDKPQRTQSQILIGHPAPRWGTPEYDALQVVATAFGGTFTGKLMTEVRVKRGLSYGAYARLHAGRSRGHMNLWVFPSADDTVETLKLVLGLYDELAEKGLSEEEIRFARQHMIGHFPFAVETPERRLGYQMDLALCGLPDDYVQRYRERIEAVSTDAIRQAVQEQVLPNNLAIALVATADRLRPELEKAKDSLRLSQIRVAAYDSF